MATKKASSRSRSAKAKDQETDDVSPKPAQETETPHRAVPADSPGENTEDPSARIAAQTAQGAEN